MMRTAAIFAALLLPQLVLGAGFAKESLFLSKQPVTEGETVFIHAVISNEASSAFAGEMVFTEGSTKIGSAPVSLDAGEAGAVSVSWKPAAGKRTVTAELKKANTVLEKTSATFSIAAKPTPLATSSAGTAAVGSSQGIQDGIEKVSPQAAEVVAPFFTLVDGGREKAAEVLDAQIESTKQKLGPDAGKPGEVLSSEDVKGAGSNPMGAFTYILQTLYLYLLTIARFLVGSAGVFYPVLALLFFYILWKVVRRFRRPA